MDSTSSPFRKDLAGVCKAANEVREAVGPGCEKVIKKLSPIGKIPCAYRQKVLCLYPKSGNS